MNSIKTETPLVLNKMIIMENVDNCVIRFHERLQVCEPNAEEVVDELALLITKLHMVRAKLKMNE